MHNLMSGAWGALEIDVFVAIYAEKVQPIFTL